MTAGRMVIHLKAQGSEPGFFGLDEHGNNINETDDE
jgi:hypothetical protein